jgi:regulator of sirC expression with transglutaminase-like and TPR domain
MGPRERFAELVRGPEHRLALRLDEAALCIAACGDPAADIGATMCLLDDLAVVVGEPTLEALVETLFGPDGLQGNRDDYYDPRNSYLHAVLDRRLGIPITLSVVAMEVGKRLDLELVGVGLPGHFVVRDLEQPDRYVDCFAGTVLDAAGCARLVAATGQRVTSADFAPVGPRAILARMLGNLKGIAIQRNDLAMLRWVMALRTSIPGVDEQGEFARYMAPLN